MKHTAESCINCGRGEQEVPLLSTRFRGAELVICTSCLPILIHKPQQLAPKLEGADTIGASEDSHH